MKYPLHGSEWFDVREFVDERTWGFLGEKAAWMVDPRIVRVCDLLREKAGVPVVVNNWHIGGQYRASGFRAAWERTGGKLSQHRLGRAADAKVSGLSPAQALALIMADKQAFLAAGLTTIEDLKFTPTWIHMDCRPMLSGAAADFVIVKP